TDLASLCFKAGVKNIGTVFLLTDTQVSDDKFLVLVNDLLASDDEVESIIGSVRPEIRSSGLMDSRENCWKFFIERVRRQLKVKQQKVRHKMFSVLTETLDGMATRLFQPKNCKSGYVYSKRLRHKVQQRMVTLKIREKKRN
ncbi:Dynein heavy chain 9, axonemal, partial [Dissostichus eleginoides]